MTLTIKLNPKAVWDDGTPITSADLECSYKAALNTPGSIATSGYDKITSIDASDPQTAVVKFKEPYAAYKNLFSGPTGGIIKKDAVANCDDISGDLQDNIPFSGRPWKQESWSKDQTVLVPNDKYWVTEDLPKATKVVMVPKADSDTEINSLKSGEVGMIFPQAFSGITDALNDPNIKYTPGYGTNYEDLYFQALQRPLQGSDLPPGLLDVGRPGPDPEDHLRADLPRLQAAAVRPVGPDGRQVVRQHPVREQLRPGRGREAPHGQRVEEGRGRPLGRRERQRADDPLDGQHRQQAP